MDESDRINFVLDLQDFANRTIPDLLDRSRVFGLERPFLFDLARDETLSFGVFLTQVAGAALELSRCFSPGARVAVMASNTTSYLILRYALSCAGMVEVAINCAHRGAVLAHMLVLAKPDAIAVEDRFAENLEACGFDLRGVALLDEHEINRIVSASQPWCERITPAVGPRDPARILFTSGTGGRSKGVELSHAYEVYTGERHNGLLGITPQDRWLYLTPLNHIDAVYIVSILLHTGGCFVLAPNFSVFRFWQDVTRSAATYLCYLGSLLALVMKGSDAPAGSTLQVALGGGASKSLIERFEARFGVRVLEAFAMTECIACTLNRFDERKTGSVGKPIDGYEVAVIDSHGDRRTPGDTGEIVVRAKEPCGLFTGYFGDADATGTALRNGWFHTGDLGAFDGEGYLYYRGRMKDSLRRRGENVSALELEEIVDTHPAVLCSAAVGVPSDLEDQEILLYVEPRLGAELEPSELCAFIEARVAPFMVPQYIRITAQLPRSDTQKIMKSALDKAPDSRTWSRRSQRM